MDHLQASSSIPVLPLDTRLIPALDAAPTMLDSIPVAAASETDRSGTMSPAPVVFPTTEPAKAGTARLFPLHLSPIETFMLTDERPGYSMTFFIELRLAGTIERQAFQQALEMTMRRHVLLSSLLKPGKAGQLCWNYIPDLAPIVDWADASAPIDGSHDKSIDLTRTVGFRLWVRQDAEQAAVLFQFHHAACDGTGAYRFIGDLLALYGQQTSETGQQPPTLIPLDPQLLRARKNNTLNLGDGPKPGLKRFAVWQGLRIMGLPPARLAPRNRASGSEALDRAFPGFLSYSFSRDQHQQIRDTAAQLGVSLNDLLLCDLFLTLADWNQQHGGWLRRRKLRIMMPTDLREAADYAMPAANMTSYAFLNRSERDCRRPDELLRSIAQETAQIKHRRPGVDFMDTIFAGTRIRGLLPWLLSRNLCLATAVLSNAADPSRRFTAQFPRKNRRVACGNLVLESITGVPPVRANTHATFSVSQYDARLTISLRCDPRRFRQEDTAALLQHYVDRLCRTAAIEVAEPAPAKKPKPR